MKYILILFTLTSCSLKAQEVEQLNWLIGKWERQNVRTGRTAFEAWEQQGSKLVGQGVTLQGADTVFVEGLSVEEKNGDLFYVANVSSNGKPTLFKITSLDSKGFVSENPEHDFPKKIVYLLEGNTLTATISGDGKDIPFVFKKAE